jgi:hypothetical protein
VTNEPNVTGHPLDGSDPDACYQTMMSERTHLITARRESEDNLIKTVIQIGSALLVVIAGFSAQKDMSLSLSSFWMAISAMVCLVVAIASGLTEHFFSSKAYGQQQKILEDYYTKLTSKFEDPPANKWVRRSQVTALISFAIGLIFVTTFAVIQFNEKSHDKPKPSAATPSAATPSAATPSAATPSAATPSAARICRQGCQRHTISSTYYAAAPAKKMT